MDVVDYTPRTEKVYPGANGEVFREVVGMNWRVCGYEPHDRFKIYQLWVNSKCVGVMMLTDDEVKELDKKLAKE